MFRKPTVATVGAVLFLLFVWQGRGLSGISCCDGDGKWAIRRVPGRIAL